MAAMVTGEPVVEVEHEARATRSRRAWWPDAAIAAVLGVVAFLYRRQFPSDGLFFDDAWQALAASKGSFSQLLTVGQTQPGFGLVLMVWSRLVGHTTVDMITPALMAGSLGPPALYLVLRRLRFARSVAATSISVTSIVLLKPGAIS